MKPRFSILTLLGITAYIAVIAAALGNPESLLAFAPVVMGVAVLLWLLPHAAGRISSKAVFARGVFLGYLVYTFVSKYEPAGWHNMLLYVFAEKFGYESGIPMVSISDQCFASVFSIAGGSLALWRYRALERREKTEQAGE